MADLKEKDSESKLNPASKDFENIVSNYGRTADPTQEDDNIKKLRNQESTQPQPTSSDPTPDIKDRENAGDTPENQFGYNAPDKKQRTVSSPEIRRKQLIGVGVGGGVIGGLLIALFALLPLKIPGIMSMVTSQTMQRVEQITEKRAKTALGRAILTKFGTHTGIVITGEGAFSTLVASMRTSGFERKLAERGLIITATSDGVKLTQNGRPLGAGKSLKNEKAILDALEKDNISNKVLKDIIREEIPSWRWMKRAKFAKWLRIKYGVPRYGLTNSTNEDPEEKKKEMDTERAERAAERTSNNFRGLLSCILSGGCEAIDGENEASKKEEDASKVAEDVDAAADESIEDVKENGLGTTEETTKTISKLLVEKLGSKAIPIIGWIDLIATLDHFAHEAGENDYVGKIAAYYKGAAYAAIYAEWSGYSSQTQLGQMDPEYVGVLANELNDAEKAQAFQAIMGDGSKGVPIETLVNSDKPSSAKELYDSIVNGPLGFQYKYIGHPILNAYYETIGGGGFLGWVAGGLGDLLGSILSPLTGILGDLTPDSVKELASDAVKYLGPLILETFGLTIDEFDKGPKLMNNIMGGGVVSANEYCKEIGCRKLSSQQAYIQNMSVAAERATDIRQKGLLYAIFNTEHPTSVTNQIAYSMPTTIEGSLSSVAHTISSTPSRLASILFPQTRADTKVSYEELYGVAPYGATDEDINQPLAPELVNGETCPDVAEDGYNNCSVDTEVVEAMICEFKPDEGECAENTPGSGEAEIEFTIGSYNQKRALSEADHMKAVNNIVSFQMDVVGTQETSEPKFSRYKRALAQRNYGSYPDQMGPNQTCVGAQAIFYNKEKFTLEKGEYFDAPRYPDPAVNCGGGEKTTAGHNTEGGKLPSVWTHIPIVWLKENATGRVVIVMNTHNVANVAGAAGTAPAYSRFVANKIYIQQIERLKAENPGTPIVFTGDFNEGTGVRTRGNLTWQGDVNNLLFCMFAKNGLMKSAAQKMKCGGYGIGGVDYIYMTPEVQVKSYKEIQRGEAASDHKAIYATLLVPGTSTAGTKLRISSFNVRGAHHTDGAPTSSASHWQNRIVRTLNVIKSKNLDVIGFQEFEPRQREYLKNHLSNYGMTTHGKDSDSIMWNNDKFSAVDKGTWRTIYFGGPIEEPWVKLKDKSTGQEFYVMNVHDPINRGQGSDRTRYENALAHKELVKKLVLTAPVMLVGDFNSAFSNANGSGAATNAQLTYCVLTSDKTMFNAYDLSVPRSAKCPNPPRGGTRNYIDHIYLTPGIEVSSFDDVPAGYSSNGSDHPTIFSDITIPGEGNEDSGSVAGGWSWPLGKKAWKDHRSAFLGSHYAGGGFLGGGNSSVDISWGGSDDGAPIYSMLDGIVKTQPLGRSSYRCVGTPNSSNNGGMMIESRVDGHVIQIAYAHGSDPKFRANQRVKSGQQILKLGNVGNSCGSHLHMDVAYDGKSVCPQDIFLSLDKGKAPNMSELVRKATLTCAGRN